MSVLIDSRTGKFFVQFVYKGETYKKHMPKGTTKTEAFKFETKWKHDLFFEGHLPEEKESVLWYQFVEGVYLPHAKANVSKESLDKALVICKAAMPFFCKRPIDQIKPLDVERFKNARMATPTMHGKPRMASTIHRELSIISRIFSLAERNDLVSYNPCRRIDLPKFDNIQNKILRLEDEEKFLASVRCHLQRDLVLMALYT
jgi:site-specific recombinase XerD